MSTHNYETKAADRLFLSQIADECRSAKNKLLRCVHLLDAITTEDIKIEAASQINSAIATIDQCKIENIPEKKS